MGGGRWRLCCGTLCAALIALVGATSAYGAFDDPLFVFTPKAPPGAPPPTGRLNGPCGVAVDSSGRYAISDYHHHSTHLFAPPLSPFTDPLVFKDNLPNGYEGELSNGGPLDNPCGLALGGGGEVYVNNFHQNVAIGGGAAIDSSHSTGVAVDSATGNVYVNDRTHVGVYDSSGVPVVDGPNPLRIGEGTLGDGYGVAVSRYTATAGRVYVPDASTDTVKVYDPAADNVNPVATIAGPPGGFVSLRDSAIAVDNENGEVYVVDTRGPQFSERPRATIYVFSPTGVYEGRLKHDVVDGQPSGLAVDNSAGTTQGRVYVTSGNTDLAGLYAYPKGAASSAALPPFPVALSGASSISPTIPIGGPAPPETTTDLSCEGDACQFLPSAPIDPTLTTLLRGLGNPRVHYRSLNRNCRPAARAARRLARQARQLERQAGVSDDPGRAMNLTRRAEQVAEQGRREATLARRCTRAVREAARRQLELATGTTPSMQPAGGAGGGSQAGPAGHMAATRLVGPAASDFGFLDGNAGFAADVREDGGAPATLAGAHPYEMRFTIGLEQDGADLRDLRIELPPGMLTNLAAVSQCSSLTFNIPRSSPFEPSSSGESCSDAAQVGTIEVQTGTEARRFGVFNLIPAKGAPAQLGAAPFGEPIVFDARIQLNSEGAYAIALEATDIPQSLDIHDLELSLWGAPWGASHDSERGNCLNEVGPGFAWAKCSVGEPSQNAPRAYLTLPTRCGSALAFKARARAWQQPAEVVRSALNRDSLGQPAEMTGCEGLAFAGKAEGFLTATTASTSSGFNFRLANDVATGLAHPSSRIFSRTRRITVALPDGVTLNAALGAGLDVCTPQRYAAETAFNPPGAGCPNASKIGDFRVRIPLYTGLLDGTIYLAMPDDRGTATPGAENPLDSLLVVYLVAKSAERGILVKLAGKIAPDPDSGVVTAVFDDLPQLPFTDLEVNFRSGQRAPLVTPGRCGDASIRIAMAPWSGGPSVKATTQSQIETGIDQGPCPDGSTPPFNPKMVTGGVNSNIGSYTPYFVHLSRQDTEQQITSYSLVLPKGITGKLAGIPFCPDAAIDAARGRGGFAEINSPSCPEASRVGRTLTSYAVGDALTYVPGNIYLGGPYNGQPLSVVTINAATVGRFDLGTIVIRSAFAVDPHTGQLQIDSRASDRIPHIIDGFPLHLREVRIYVDRPNFTRNPTSCEASQMVSTLTGSGARLDDSSDDSTATVSEHFQLLNCLTLGFEPKLGMRLRGGSRRGAHPSLRATFASRGGRDANLKQIEVTMPHSMFLAQNHIRQICTRSQFGAGQCPKGSKYGEAVASTPLFDEPLRGNVYLRSSRSRLPDLVADLYSGAVRIVLEGKIGPAKQGIRAAFENLPDAPIERFVMTLSGGRRGLLVNSSDICAVPPLATVKALGQNNIGAAFTTELRGQCKKKRRAR